jgi:hypothetical protein
VQPGREGPFRCAHVKRSPQSPASSPTDPNPNMKSRSPASPSPVPTRLVLVVSVLVRGQPRQALVGVEHLSPLLSFPSPPDCRRHHQAPGPPPRLPTPSTRRHGVGCQQEEGRPEEGRRGCQEGRQGRGGVLLVVVCGRGRGRRQGGERRRGAQAIGPDLHRRPRVSPALPRYPREHPFPTQPSSSCSFEIRGVNLLHS